MSLLQSLSPICNPSFCIRAAYVLLLSAMLVDTLVGWFPKSTHGFGASHYAKCTLWKSPHSRIRAHCDVFCRRGQCGWNRHGWHWTCLHVPAQRAYDDVDARAVQHSTPGDCHVHGTDSDFHGMRSTVLHLSAIRVYRCLRMRYFYWTQVTARKGPRFCIPPMF